MDIENQLHEAIDEKKEEILLDYYVAPADGFGNREYSAQDEEEALERAKQYFITLINEV